MPLRSYRIRTVFVLAAALAPAACLKAQGGAPRPRAVFIVVDTASNRVGQVIGSEAGGNVVLEIMARGLKPGKHGLHLHQSPVCEGPAFESAGGHFNPTDRKHGTKNPDGAHAGDLPNLLVEADGVGRGQVTVSGWTLAAGPHSIGKPGVSLVIHADPDDDLTDPSGNSGARVACAVIQLPG